MKIVMDDYCYLECSIEDRNPVIKVKGSYTTTNENYLGRVSKFINCGKMRNVELDLSLDIQIEFIKKFDISDDEKAVGFYTTTDLVLIYFNLDTKEIGHQISPRE